MADARNRCYLLELLHDSFLHTRDVLVEENGEVGLLYTAFSRLNPACYVWVPPKVSRVYVQDPSPRNRVG